MSAPVVLVHGGGFDRRCWELLIPSIEGPVMAVDLPGRGNRSAQCGAVGFAECAAAIRDDVVDAGFGDVVLVGHSQAGCSLPAAMQLLGDRLREVVFVAALVPGHGRSPLQELAPDVEDMVDAAVEEKRTVMDPEMARIFFGNDLDEQQFAWCLERMVPELPALPRAPVDLSGIGSAVPRRWVRTTRDAILAPDMQTVFAERARSSEVIDLDAGHMCMISQPEALAAIINGIAAG